MSRYQPQQNYADAPSQPYGNSYADGGNGYGGYSDEPQGGGYAKNSYPMASSNPYASGGSPRGYDAPKKKRNKWLWIGLPLLLLIIIGAVLGGVLGTQLGGKDNNDNSNSSSGNSNSGANRGNAGNTLIPSGVSNANTATSVGANGERYLAIATDTNSRPIYAAGTATAGMTAPTVLSSASAGGKWPSDPETPSNSSLRSHPRLGAPEYKWAALNAGLISDDPYIKYWNDQILANASATIGDAPVAYESDGDLASGSGVLDVARQMKVKVKNWAYAYRVTNETRYADRVFLELQTAAGNNSEVPFGADGTRWNAAHFLDLAEFSATFAIGYDWLYDFWTAEQREAIKWSILNLGLSFGVTALEGNGDPYWWIGSATSPINGNWNCVCNAGLLMAALAIRSEDESGVSQRIIDAAVPNARDNCFRGAYSDGTWAETPDYWYFGTTGAAEIVSSLITATGDDHGLSTANPGWRNTSLAHMYVTGQTTKFSHGDSGPKKFSATANSLLLWADVFDEPRYALYQRDQADAPEPWSVFWYDPATTGIWWDGLALDKHFDSTEANWGTARSSWSDTDGTYWAMKTGLLTGHQTHGDLDLGDFVVDAIGQRWFGELGSGQYLSPGYFSSEAQDSQRWLYYRKRTEGQNTIMIGNQNQLVSAQPSAQWGSSGTSQGLAPSFNVSTDDTAFYTCDISSAYNDATVKRGIRFINGRKQILIQDDIAGVPSGTNIQWRAQTNATITPNGASATLELGGETLIATIINGPSGATFSREDATSDSSDPAPPAPTGQERPGNVPNEGVSVLVVDIPGGSDFSLSILLNPQWEGMAAGDFVTPPNVGIDSWSLTSHN